MDLRAVAFGTALARRRRRPVRGRQRERREGLEETTVVSEEEEEEEDIRPSDRPSICLWLGSPPSRVFVPVP